MKRRLELSHNMALANLRFGLPGDPEIEEPSPVHIPDPDPLMPPGDPDPDFTPDPPDPPEPQPAVTLIKSF